MTDDLTRAEEALRAVLATHADDAPGPVGLWTAVRSRHRRRRAALAGATAVGAAVAVAVPAVALSGRTPTVAPAGPSGPVATTGSTGTTAPPARPISCGPSRPAAPAAPGLKTPVPVPGSLGGDLATVTAVLRSAWRDDLSRQDVLGQRLDPTTAHVRMVQRTDDGLIVGVVGATVPGGRYGWETFVVGTDPQHLSAASAVGAFEGSGGTALPQRGAFLNQTGECGRTNVVVVAPPGSTGTAAWVTDVAADGTVRGGDQPIPLRPDGVAVFPPPAAAGSVRVRLVHEGREVGSLAVGEGGGSTAPSAGAISAAAGAAPGDGDRAAAAGLLRQQFHEVPLAQADLRVLWRGRDGDRTAAVATTRLPTGARYVWGAVSTSPGGPLRYFDGVLPAAGLDRSALRFRPEGSDRAVVVFAGTRQVTVDGQRRSVAGGLVVAADAEVQVAGLDLVESTDLTRLPGGTL